MTDQSPESTNLGPGGSDPVMARTAQGEPQKLTPAADEQRQDDREDRRDGAPAQHLLEDDVGARRRRHLAGL